MNKQIRKQQLDQLMREFYFEKNAIEDTIEFLAIMYKEYMKIRK